MLKKMKKVLATGLVLAMMAMMFGGWAAAKSAATVNLTLWGAQQDQKMLKQMVESFKAANPKKTFNIKVAVLGEPDVPSNLLKDIDTAADVFSFPSDQIATLQSAGALMPITINTKNIKAANSPASVNAATVKGQLYAYPSVSDTYFLYYDKKYFKESDVASLEKMMAKDLPKGVTNFEMNVSNSWYIASFFFASGNQLFGPAGTDPTKCDFNNAKGVAAANYIIDLANNPKFKDFQGNHESAIVQAFKDRKLAACVSGTWKAKDLQAALGKDYAATKLPTIKLNGKDVNMGSFANFKLVGVNSHTKHPAEAMALADFITNKNSQFIRFQTRSLPPTNVKLASYTSILSSNVAVGACAKQNKYATLQTSINQMGKYWDPAAALGTGIVNGKITKANIQSELDKLVQQILAKIN